VQLAQQALRARPPTPPRDSDEDDERGLRAEEKAELYAAECEARRKRMDYVLDSVRKKGSRLERRSKQRKQRFEEQEALRESVDARSAEIMDETTGRIGGVLAERTRELATRLERRTETLVETLLHAWDEFDAAWTHGVLVSCWDAMREPVRWKRAVALSNKWKLRRMIRIANRFSSIERNIHRYYQLRLCRSVLWAWLYATATSLGAARPGFHDIIRGRRIRAMLFSRLLIAERSPGCPRCLFARWLERVHLKVTRRTVVSTSRERCAARWMGKCFYAWRTGKSAPSYDERIEHMHSEGLQHLHNPAEGLGGPKDDGQGGTVPMLREYPPWVRVVYGGRRELAAATELDRWVTKVLRPELYSEWTRRKNRWVRRRMLRLASESVMRRLLLCAIDNLSSRLKHESDLHFDASSSEDAMPSPYLSSALQLREFECRANWAACMSLAKALVHSDREDKPHWVEPLTKPHIAVGLARWMANATSHGLPRLLAVDAAGEETRFPSQLPRREDSHVGKLYWDHHEWLLEQAKLRQKKARRK